MKKMFSVLSACLSAALLLGAPALMAGFGLAGSATAQIACPDGMQPVPLPGNANAGWTCGNTGLDVPERYVPPGMDDRNLPTPTRPAPKGFWGSLVQSADGRIYSSAGVKTRKGAEEGALGKCQSDIAARGLTSACRPLITSKDNIALAFDGSNYFAGRTTGITNVGYAMAAEKALKACREGAGAAVRCRIVMVFDPPFGKEPDFMIPENAR